MRSTLRNLYLVLSQKCNLDCSYCYAQGGHFGEPESLMGQETLRRALEAALPQAGESLVVSFFGGEPFLNFERMKEAVEYGNRWAREQGKEIRYAVTTNGTLATDEMVRFLKTHISYLAVSLDGDACANDEGRRFRFGNRSVHDTVLRTIGRLREEGIAFAIRATVSEGNAKRVRQTAAYLGGLGANAVRIVPALSQGKWTPASLTELVEGFCGLDASALNRIAQGEAPLGGEHFHKALAGTVGGAQRRYPCSAGESVLAIAANGDIYPCDHFIGSAPFRIGSVHDSGWPEEPLAKMQALLRANSVDDRAQCRCCSVRYLCGGECHAVALMGQGDIATPGSAHCMVTRNVYSRLTAHIAGLARDEGALRNLKSYLG